MLPPALLLDLDGTLLQQGIRRDVLREVACAFADDLGPMAPDTVADVLDRALRAYWADPDHNARGRMDVRAARRHIVASSLSELGAGRWDATVCEQFARRFADTRDELLHVAPGALQALADLRARGVRMALVTNGSADFQRQKLRRFNLDPYFDHLQIEGERGFGKPNPQAYLEALTALGVTAPQAWMVGDDLERDVAAPQRLGILGVWRDRLGAGMPAGSSIRPHRIIHDVAELLD